MAVVKEKDKRKEGRDSWKQEAYLEAVVIIQASKDEK